MLTSYIQAALRLAKYEIMEDGAYYGEIPGFEGVWASASTLESCREELRETLEDWLVLGLRMGHVIPVVANIDLIHVGASSELDITTTWTTHTCPNGDVTTDPCPTTPSDR